MQKAQTMSEDSSDEDSSESSEDIDPTVENLPMQSSPNIITTIEEVKEPLQNLNMNVIKKNSMAQRVKQKHQKTAYNAHMVSAGVSMMKENNVRQALTYDDGSVAE